jgi:hypothetical protein
VPEETVPPIAPGVFRTGPLAPGTYTFRFDHTSVSFRLGQGWNNTFQIPNVGFDLVRQLDLVFQGTSLFVTAGGVAEVLRSLERTPGLTVCSQARAAIGGRDTTQIDVTVNPGQHEPLGVLPVGEQSQDPQIGLLPDEKAWFYVLDPGGHRRGLGRRGRSGGLRRVHGQRPSGLVVDQLRVSNRTWTTEA